MRRSVVCLGIWGLIACSGDLSDAPKDGENAQLDAAILMPGQMAGSSGGAAGSAVPSNPVAGSGPVQGAAGSAGFAGTTSGGSGTGNAGMGGSAGSMNGSAGGDPDDAGMPVADSGTQPELDAGMPGGFGPAEVRCTNPLPVYYERTLPDRSDSRWDFAQVQPQVVVVNLGTNDFSTDQDPSETQFTDAYRDFLERVRGKYPDALILCTIGPLLWGEELDRVRAYIVNAIAATGDDNMASYEMPPQSEADGLGCGYHPSIKTHQKMADLLVDELETRLGW